MTRSTRTAPKAPVLYARIRQILDPYTKLLVVAKGRALRDEFSEVRMAADATNRKSKTNLLMEGEPIGYALRSQLAAPQTPPEILYAPRGESRHPGYGLPGAMRERAGHGG
jgi:hypothetical protein